MTALANYRSASCSAGPTNDGRCAFCTNDFPVEQRLGRIGDLNIISPLGQLVPGSLVAFQLPTNEPADPCFSVSTGDYVRDLEDFEHVADAFTRSLGEPTTVFYEHGRAGGGQLLDSSGFWHHAHYCSWPGRVDMVKTVRRLAPTVTVSELDDLSQLGLAVAGRPYVLVRTYAEGVLRDSRLILPSGKASWAALETLRFKVPLAKQLGLDDFHDWRNWAPERTLQTGRDFRAFAGTMAAS